MIKSPYLLLTGVPALLVFTLPKAVGRRPMVIGLDNLNNYYDVRLKEIVQISEGIQKFTFVHASLEDLDTLNRLFKIYFQPGN